FLAVGATLRAPYADSLGCGSRWTTCRAWSRSARRQRRAARRLGDIYFSIFPDRRGPLLYPANSQSPEAALWSAASSRHSSQRNGRAKVARAAARPPSFENGAARAQRRDLPPRLPQRAPTAFRANPARRRCPRADRPTAQSAWAP